MVKMVSTLSLSLFAVNTGLLNACSLQDVAIKGIFLIPSDEACTPLFLLRLRTYLSSLACISPPQAPGDFKYHVVLTKYLCSRVPQLRFSQ